MYSEIKNENTILINRLDDSERILLKSIYDKSENAKITMKELTDESGDFGGVLVKVESDKEKPGTENKVIEFKEEIPETLLTKVGEPVVIKLDTNIPNNDFVLVYNSDKPDLVVLDASSKDLSFIITPYFSLNPSFMIEPKTIEVTINYSIMATGFEPISKTIKVTAEPAELVTCDFTVMDYDMNYRTVESMEMVNEETSEVYEPTIINDYIYRFAVPIGNYLINSTTKDGTNSYNVYLDEPYLIPGYYKEEPFEYELPQN